MLDTREAAIMHAWLFQEFSAGLLPSAKWEIPFTITHSILRSCAAAKRPGKNNKKSLKIQDANRSTSEHHSLEGWSRYDNINNIIYHATGGHKIVIVILKGRYKSAYYIDMSVLLENIPLVKFTKTTSGTRVVYFP